METELSIERVGLMGQGVGQDAESNIYFVPGAIPGDRVVVRPLTVDKRYRDAELVRVTSPSGQRQDPICPVFGQCGGCDWLHWEYPAQVQAKQSILQHVLERASWEPEAYLPPVAAERPLGYRNRIQLRSDGQSLGFYRRRSHDIVAIDSCAVAHPKLNAAIAGLKEELKGLGTRKVELAVQPDGTVLRLDNQPHAAAGFAQVHDAQNEALKQRVAEWVRQAGAASVLELYAGNGNLTQGYLDNVEEVWVVDQSEAAIAEARRVLSPSRGRLGFLQARIDSKLARRLPGDFRRRYDTLLLDPPRSGAEGCFRPLLHEGLKNIVYVSCSPVSFTKDVACLKEEFRFRHVQVIDMFPHTRHIEFVALFSR